MPFLRHIRKRIERKGRNGEENVARGERYEDSERVWKKERTWAAAERKERRRRGVEKVKTSKAARRAVRVWKGKGNGGGKRREPRAE